jgi:hypothetical protein
MRLKLAAALASLLAIVAILARRSGVRAAARRLSARRGARTAGARPQPAREPWRCECGQDFLVAGRDRHRIYWLQGAAESEPLLGDRCPSCDRPLPAEHQAGAAVA